MTLLAQDIAAIGVRQQILPNLIARIGFGARQPAANEGRSGYWRLFYTNLQEESLKKDAESKDKKTVQADRVVQVKRPANKRRVAKRTVRVIESEIRAAPAVPFKLNPVADAANTYDQLAGIVPLPEVFFSVQIYGKITSIEAAQTKRKQRNRRRAAAFLLLAA